MMKKLFLGTIGITLLFSACQMGPAVGSVVLSLEVPRNGGFRGGPSREIPSTLDSMYVHLVVDNQVVQYVQEPVAAGQTSVTLELAAAPGTYTLHAFALKNNMIIGMAQALEVSLQNGETTQVAVTMESLNFNSIGSFSYNPADSLTNDRYLNPSYEFYPWLLAGTPELYVKRSLDYSIPEPPEAWDDYTFRFPAESEENDGFHLSGSVPADTFLTDQGGHFWFVVRWPGSPAVLVSELPEQAMYVMFNW